MKFATGAVFGNRYTLGERIAVGGMGEVWEATDQVLGRIVAIKLLSPALADQAGFAQRFREEARNTAALSHPNIAAVYDYGEDAGANWLVMELVKGRPLSTIITEEAPLGPERTSVIAAQAALALQVAHDRGVVHRDVKPANILVKPDGTVKLTDFGISRATDAAPITRTGEVMGTAQYISPEQATGKAVSPKSDLYALGCVMYEMLTGTRPFDEGSPVATAMAHVGTPPPPLPPEVPAGLAQLVMACLAKDPDQRPASGRVVADALRGAPVSSFAPTAPMAAVTERLDSPAVTRLAPRAGAATAAGSTAAAHAEEEERRSPWRWLLPLLALLVLLGGWALFAQGDRDDDRTPAPAPATTTVTTTATPTSEPTTEPTDDPTSRTTSPSSTTTTTEPADEPSTTTPSSSTSTPAEEPTRAPTSDAPPTPAPAPATTQAPAPTPPSQDAPAEPSGDAASTGAAGVRGPGGAGVAVPAPTHTTPDEPATAEE